MTVSIIDAESAFLDALVEFREWKDKAEAAWLEPLGETLVATGLESADPETLAVLREMDPEAFDTVMMRLGGRHATTNIG